VNDVPAVDGLSEFLVDAVNRAQSIDTPFHHIEFDRFFPADLYRQMIELMPVSSDYRPMSGRSKDRQQTNGAPTRVKIDLFPEYIRLLPPRKRTVWDLVGRALVRPACRTRSCNVSRRD
jgi:hypothetical protein